MLSFFPLDVLGDIWDLIESVSEGFLPTLNMRLRIQPARPKNLNDAVLHAVELEALTGLNVSIWSLRSTCDQHPQKIQKRRIVWKRI